MYPKSEIMVTTKHVPEDQAHIHYSPLWKVSNEVFTKAAAEILGVSVDRVEVRRCVLSGKNHGKLTVYVYGKYTTKRVYYHMDKSTMTIRFLSPQIDEFKKSLADFAAVNTIE